ncbi:response regulator transcription factor [Bacillus shivajii]|uniref:response regulator transcription factor n=1 Tax=Bacillus shivajii TaxID=1983719 RepID=UPI001CFACC5F|nr:response regulator transcription factor [Bacillus shivajii]UCZ55388.1 response regulator transcription factor [Bacillus shivajii]
MMKQNILVVDDEQHMQHLLNTMLTAEGYRVFTAFNGKEAMETLRQGNVEFVILDIMMPGIDGYRTCEMIREISDVPVLMLTAKASDEDKVKGLRKGADDYLVKPFGKEELLARIEAILRRTKIQSTTTKIENKKVVLGELFIEPVSKEVFVGGKKIKLTKKEYELLLLLASRPRVVFDREQLLTSIWGFDYENVTSRTVDTHVKTLRIKLESAGGYIKTVWGMGYKLEVGA